METSRANPLTVARELLGTQLELTATQLGEDICIIVRGGTPHIGCTLLSIPRPSLDDEERMSCTTSVLNVVGHKDDGLCRRIAERTCSALGRTVACTGGFHLDGIAPEGIAELLCAAEDAADELIGHLRTAL